MNNKQLDRMMRNHVSQIAEHFESVRIFVTMRRRDKDGDGVTVASSWGAGNMYAVMGQVGEWIEQQHAIAYNQAMNNSEGNMGDDGEEDAWEDLIDDEEGEDNKSELNP